MNEPHTETLAGEAQRLFAELLQFTAQAKEQITREHVDRCFELLDQFVGLFVRANGARYAFVMTDLQPAGEGVLCVGGGSASKRISSGYLRLVGSSVEQAGVSRQAEELRQQMKALLFKAHEVIEIVDDVALECMVTRDRECEECGEPSRSCECEE